MSVTFLLHILYTFQRNILPASYPTYVIFYIIFIYRYFCKFKRNVTNKARVGGSIASAYLVEEATKFSSHYFEPYVYTRHWKVLRNTQVSNNDRIDGMLKIFSHPRSAYGRSHSQFLSNEEYDTAQLYILINYDSIFPYQ